ncbi:MAG TPA: fatty acid desaturase [Bacteroidota bacterium]|nr:fatty acid desaturase [Bacteroidota bacterium]
MSRSTDFVYTDTPEPHRDRTKAILKGHPEIRSLIGRNPLSFFLILFVVALQTLLAAVVSHQPWWVALILAYVVGAYANHSLFVLIHECAHNLIFQGKAQNILAGMLADIPNVVPSSVSFRIYHLKHHSFQGDYSLDADLPSRWEARIVGSTFLGKTLWLLFFPVFQALRPPRLKEIPFANIWTVINWIAVVVCEALIVYLFGPGALLYFALSFFFSIGLHPLGARWIQEHYLTFPPQETYSYYGPLNILALNVGYHNEHHDLPSVPWNKLPRMKQVAPEWYDNLVSHKSWTKLLWRFLTDPDLSLFSRLVRSNRAGEPVTAGV